MPPAPPVATRPTDSRSDQRSRDAALILGIGGRGAVLNLLVRDSARCPRGHLRGRWASRAKSGARTWAWRPPGSCSGSSASCSVLSSSCVGSSRIGNSGAGPLRPVWVLHGSPTRPHVLTADSTPGWTWAGRCRVTSTNRSVQGPWQRTMWWRVSRRYHVSGLHQEGTTAIARRFRTSHPAGTVIATEASQAPACS